VDEHPTAVRDATERSISVAEDNCSERQRGGGVEEAEADAEAARDEHPSPRCPRYQTA
jgi:hypothetical protein